VWHHLGCRAAAFELPDRFVRVVRLAEHHDQWAEARRYLGLDVPARCRVTVLNRAQPEHVTRAISTDPWLANS
jgi:hypothetical protein